MQIFSFLLIGLAAGLLSGFMGVGGGIIIVPMLMLMLSFDQHTAQGHSLGVLVLPVVLAGFLQYWHNPAVKINLIGVALMAGAFVAGGYFGGRWANTIDAASLRKIFAVFLALNAVYLFLKR